MSRALPLQSFQQIVHFFVCEAMFVRVFVARHMLICLFFLIALSLSSPLLSGRQNADPLASNSTVRPSPALGAPLSRNVSIILDLDYTTPKLSPNGTRMLGGHLALHVAGTDTEGPIQIEVIKSTALAVRLYDWNPSNSHQPIPVNASQGFKRTIYPIGQTNLSNPIFLDPETGLGLLLTLVQQRKGYLSGWSSGLHLVRDLAMIVGQPRDPRFFHKFHLMEQYERLPPLLAQKSLPLLLERLGTWGDNSTNTFVQFRTDLMQNSTLHEPDAESSGTSDPFAGLSTNASSNGTSDPVAGLSLPHNTNATIGGSISLNRAASSDGNVLASSSAQMNGNSSFEASPSSNETGKYEWLLRLLDDAANAPFNGTSRITNSSRASYGVPISPAPWLSPDSASSPSGTTPSRRLLLDPWQQTVPSESPHALPSIVRRQQPPPQWSTQYHTSQLMGRSRPDTQQLGFVHGRPGERPPAARRV